jgi:hypothetical protein
MDKFEAKKKNECVYYLSVCVCVCVCVCVHLCVYIYEMD